MRWAHVRSSHKRYTARPPANCKAARTAWDMFAESGPVEIVWLSDGYWCVQRNEDDYEDIDAIVVRDKAHSN